MNIESVKYIAYESKNISIILVADGETLYVPLNPANRHYQAIQEWVAEGNTIQEAD